MRIPRIYQPTRLQSLTQVSLTSEASHHVERVLRMAVGEELELFDGSNSVFAAIIVTTARKCVTVRIKNSQIINRESPLHLHLGQVISRGEKMEFTIQKAVELGVNVITPLLSHRCGVKLDTERLNKKIEQWQKIAIAACEQCGRNTIPIIQTVNRLETWCQESDFSLKLQLHPRATQSIKMLPASVQGVRLLIGSEGGLTQEEIELVEQNTFTSVLLGPRVLRTETAAIAAITTLQAYYGDLS